MACDIKVSVEAGTDTESLAMLNPDDHHPVNLSKKVAEDGDAKESDADGKAECATVATDVSYTSGDVYVSCKLGCHVMSDYVVKVPDTVCELTASSKNDVYSSLSDECNTICSSATGVNVDCTYLNGGGLVATKVSYEALLSSGSNGESGGNAETEHVSGHDVK